MRKYIGNSNNRVERLTQQRRVEPDKKEDDDKVDRPNEEYIDGVVNTIISGPQLSSIMSCSKTNKGNQVMLVHLKGINKILPFLSLMKILRMYESLTKLLLLLMQR